MPFEQEGRAYPYVDRELEALIVGHKGDWLISVTPMIFNDRIIVSHRTGYPHSAVAGWCYPKGGAALIAANAWLAEWEERTEPEGFIKEAFNEMQGY